MQTVSSSALFSGLPSYFTLSFCVEWSDGYSSGAAVVVHIVVENQPKKITYSKMSRGVRVFIYNFTQNEATSEI